MIFVGFGVGLGGHLDLELILMSIFGSLEEPRDAHFESLGCWLAGCLVTGTT